MFVAEHLIPNLAKGMENILSQTDGGTWYRQAYRFLTLQRHHNPSSYEKNHRKDYIIHRG
jgi:hypothetical protein